jgi:site-specific DNA-methyltransferase (adenine-specific)
MLDTWDDITYVYAGSVVHPEAILRPGTCKKEHPCQMPQGIAARAMLFSTDPGDLIVDPFSGSGTTLRTAKNLSRKAIVIEIDERYCELAVKRMRQTVMAL